MIGDLITIDHKIKFPTALRSGPGYACTIIGKIEPSAVGVIIESKTYTSMTVWIQIFVCSTGQRGWIPKFIIN